MSLSELGAYLQRHREEQGLSLEQLEAATRVRRVHLESIESGSWDSLPPGVYVRGLLKSYAKAVGLSPETVQRMYFKERPAEATAQGPRILSQPLLREPRLSMESVLALVFIAAAAFILWWLYQTYIRELIQPTFPLAAQTATAGAAGLAAGAATLTLPAGRPAPTTAVPVAASGDAVPTAVRLEPLAGSPTDAAGPASPAPELTAAPTAVTTAPAGATATVAAGRTPSGSPTARASATPAGGLGLLVQSKGSVWLRISLDDGATPGFEGFLKQGDQDRWQGNARRKISLRTGNAGDTEVSLNGQKILGQVDGKSTPSLGKAGEVVNMEWVLLPDGKVQQTRSP